MQDGNREYKANLGIVVTVFFSDVEKIKKFIEEELNGDIRFIRTVPPYVRLFVNTESQEGREGQ